MRERSVALPSESILVPSYPGADLADAYRIALPEQATADIGQLARAVLGHPSLTFRTLLGMRDRVVAPFGLPTAASNRQHRVDAPRIHIFKIVETRQSEMILGGNASHLHFRMSVLDRANPDTHERELVLTSVVHCQNQSGRLYIAIIRPFHIGLVRSFLRRAADRGWPAKPR